MSSNEECFLITSLDEEVEFTYGDNTDVVWAEGMIGVMPVFDTKEHAMAFVNKDESLITRMVREKS